MPNQATVAAPCEMRGAGLHLGRPVNLRLLPAEEDAGIVFRVLRDGRSTDIPADIAHIHPKNLRTALAREGGVVVETVEHILAAAYGLGLTNLVIEMDNSEPPAMDGGAAEMCRRILAAGIREQAKPRKVFVVREPLSIISEEGSGMTIFPHEEGLKISYTLAGDGLPTQQVIYEHSREAFLSRIAPARTFCRSFEVDKLRSLPDVGRGATLDNTLVVQPDDLTDKQRIKDELACHKILDLLGDLCLLGREVRGYMVCNRTGHITNHLFLKRLAGPQYGKVMDIRQIREILPYSYPFLLVDRILDYEENVRVVGLKNVTINEPFFQGHFPGEPIMPGVLLVESLAQTGALMMYRSQKEKLVLFMGVDKVKFRSRVVPGDQLILEVTTRNMRANVGIVKGVASVRGETACEAEMKFMIVER